MHTHVYSPCMSAKNTSSGGNSGICLNLSYRKATRVISQIYDRELAECGIKCTQFTILRATSFRKQTTNAELQDILILNQTTLTRGLKPLIRDGLIQVEVGQDRRQKILSLTKEGQKLYIEAEKKWQVAQKYIRERLGQTMTDQMIEMNNALVKLHQ